MICWTVRHPVGSGFVRWGQDPQDVAPPAWCVRCGGELWDGMEACEHCRNRGVRLRAANDRPYMHHR